LGRRDESTRELDAFKSLRDRKPGPATPLKATRTPFEARIWDTCQRLVDADKEAEALAYLDSLPKEDGLHPSYLLGVLYFNLQRPADAVRLLTRAKTERPTDADVLAFLGRAQVAAGQLEAAQSILAQAREMKPNAELALVGTGELEYARAHWDDAIRYFELSKTAQVPVLLKLCRAYGLIGKRDQALEAATLVRAFGHDDPASLRELDAALAVEPASTPATSVRP
jgi:tetratricopeptide (TPR) repeat protein